MTKSITLKLKTAFIGQPMSDGQTTVRFYPDYNDERNKAWAKYTPAASLEMVVKSDIAEEYFSTGQNFLVTLTPED